MQDPDLIASAQKAVDEAGFGGAVTVVASPIPGVVKLLGRVASESDRLKADQAARSADDVMDVIDEITLGRVDKR